MARVRSPDERTAKGLPGSPTKIALKVPSPALFRILVLLVVRESTVQVEVFCPDKTHPFKSFRQA